MIKIKLKYKILNKILINNDKYCECFSNYLTK